METERRVAAIVLFVCMAVYLNWSYNHDNDQNAETGKTLGEAALVGAQTDNSVLSGDDTQGVVTTGYFSAARP
jgi:stage III sporulation protein AH